MKNNYTVPNQALQPKKSNPHSRRTLQNNRPKPPQQQRPVMQAPPPAPKRAAQTVKAQKRKFSLWLLLVPSGLFTMFVLILLGGLLMLQLSYANKILPRVQVAGIDVGSMTQSEAANVLNSQWTRINLTDGETAWQANPGELGITLDVQASAERAFAQGHGEGGWTGHLRTVNVTPVITIDANAMNTALANLAGQIEQAPQNAGVDFVNGRVVPTDPVNGTMIDIQATINTLQRTPSLIADGTLDLVMLDVAPQITDATPLVAQAESLLSSPLDIRVFDPVTGDSVYWSSLPAQWSNWLTATSDPNSSLGLALSVDGSQVRQYLSNQINTQLDSSRTLDLDTAVASVQGAFANGTPQTATVTIQHTDRTHTVQAGESITSIAWDYGIPYLYVIQANGGIESVSVGQQITIPAADTFISDAFNPNKRIVVSISQQRTYVYENGQLLYEWASSTGINSSPTWTGVYQVISHEPNAYAANWNLYMPNFIGVYEPVPGSDFTNGFHGFPTRGGGQLLWENSLGTRVTYGCILLSDQHVAILYDWAEEGVIVEIRA